MPVVGETKDAGFQIGVSRTFAIDPALAWEVLVGPGLATWLGVEELPTEKGQRYEAADGTVGELRSLRPGDRIRLTWQPVGWTHDSTLQVAVSGTPGKAVVRFHQERLTGPAERERQRRHWQHVMDELALLLG